MTGDIEYLCDVRGILSLYIVRLPNGNCTSAGKQGTMNLSGNIYLQHILFIPDLKCTLISVVKLLQELKCTITFGEKLFVIQGHNMRTLIAVGKLCNGVYHFVA